MFQQLGDKAGDKAGDKLKRNSYLDEHCLIIVDELGFTASRAAMGFQNRLTYWCFVDMSLLVDQKAHRKS